MTARKAIPVKVQVSVAIAQAYGEIRCPVCCERLWSQDERVLEHMTPHALCIALGRDPDEPDNLRWAHKACAATKTNGTKATCAGGDIHKIAKAKRLAAARTAHEAVVKREAEKARGSIKSAGFSKSLRKRMNGKIEQREQRT